MVLVLAIGTSQYLCLKTSGDTVTAPNLSQFYCKFSCDLWLVEMGVHLSTLLRIVFQRAPN